MRCIGFPFPHFFSKIVLNAILEEFMYRKTLSADGMLAILRKSFENIANPRGSKANIKTTDALMTAALPVFSFKTSLGATVYPV